MKTATLPPAELYEEDFYAWTQDQARELRRLRELRPNVPLDLEHLAEEVAGLGKEQRNALRSWTVQIMTHLLFLTHSPAREPRHGWENEIGRARTEVELRMTPTLRRDLQRNRLKLYALAARRTRERLNRYGESATALPETCPYSLDKILADWWPDADNGDAR
jgi:hypothetical protein